MTENPEFDLDAELLSAELAPRPEPETEPSAPPPSQAAPVVMIQYRNRGLPPVLLFPTTLILSLGMFAAYHYLFVAPRQRELQEQARRQASAAWVAAANVESAEDVEPSPPLMGLSLDSQPLPPGFQLPLPPPTFEDSETTRVAAKPVDAPGPNDPPAEPAAPKPNAPAAVESATVAVEPSAEPAPPPPIGLDPSSAVADVEQPRPGEKEDASPLPPAAPTEVVKEEPAVATVATLEPKPSPTREEMMQALEAEAAANRAARVEQNQAREQARAQVETEAQDRVEAERELFHDALKRILDAGGPASDAGQQINALCDQFGRHYGGDLKAQVLGALSRFHGKISRDNEIKMLRSLGVPEAGILDYLANVLERRSINSRNGPGSPDEVRVMAAGQLLRAKASPRPLRGGAPAPAPAQHVRRSRPAR